MKSKFNTFHAIKDSFNSVLEQENQIKTSIILMY